MKSVYICAKYQGDIKQNIENARRFSNYVFKMGYLPICVHLFLEQVTDLKEEKNRDDLIEVSKDYLRLCDELWILQDSHPGEGMKAEIRLANKLNMPIRSIPLSSI